MQIIHHPLAVEATKTPIDWDEGGRYHNWRNHVGDNVKAIWDTLTDPAKIAIARDADELAGREEWE